MSQGENTKKITNKIDKNRFVDKIDKLPSLQDLRETELLHVIS